MRRTACPSPGPAATLRETFAEDVCTTTSIAAIISGMRSRRIRPANTKFSKIPFLLGSFPQMVLQNSIADEEEANFWIVANDFRHRIEKLIVPLKGKQPCDLADDGRVGGDAEFTANRGAIEIRLEEPIEFHTAIDCGEAFGRRDAAAIAFLLMISETLM